MNTSTASSGHLLFVNGSIMDGTFECDPVQLPVLNEAITTYSSLVNKHSLDTVQKPFTGEISLVELLAYINAYCDISNPLLKDMADCLLVIHRKSITIH